MKRIGIGSCLLILLAVQVFAAADDPVIQVANGKVSIQAVSVTLSQFLKSFDAATGMTSKAPPELANQKFSVRLSDLTLDAAIHKSFQGQPWNYGYIPGKGIIVLGRAQEVAPTTGVSLSSPIQTYTPDFRPDSAPLPTQNPLPVAQPGPVPTNAGGTGQPSGNTNLPPAQGGAPAPTPTFAPIGGVLGGALPTTQPGGR